MQLKRFEIFLNGQPSLAKSQAADALSRPSEASRRRREAFTARQSLTMSVGGADVREKLKNLQIKPNLCPKKWGRYKVY